MHSFSISSILYLISYLIDEELLMRTLSIIIVILLFLANIGRVNAEEIALACKYEHSFKKNSSNDWDYTGPTSGGLGINIQKLRNTDGSSRNKVIVSTSEYGQMLGEMNSYEVYAEYEEPSGSKKILEIDRNTGRFAIAMDLGSSGIMFQGKCSVTKKLF